MKFTPLVLLCLLACVGLCGRAAGAKKTLPESHDIKVYKQLLPVFEKKAKAFVARHPVFVKEQAFINRLKVPIKTGGRVTISVRRVGTTFGPFTAHLREVRKDRAVFVNQDFKARDIDAVDWRRLQFADKPKELAAEVKRLQDTLNARKSAMVNRLKARYKREAGYTEAFFERTIPWAGKFRDPEEFGRFRLMITVCPASGAGEDAVPQLVFLALRNRRRLPCAAVLFLDRKPLLTQTAIGKGGDLEDVAWGEAEAALRWQDLAGGKAKQQQVVAAFLKKLELRVLKQDLGHWEFKVVGRRALKPEQIAVPCPECLGNGKTKPDPPLPGKKEGARPQRIQCKTCNGDKRVVAPAGTVLLQADFQLVRQSIRKTVPGDPPKLIAFRKALLKRNTDVLQLRRQCAAGIAAARWKREVDEQTDIVNHQNAIEDKKKRLKIEHALLAEYQWHDPAAAKAAEGKKDFLHLEILDWEAAQGRAADIPEANVPAKLLGVKTAAFTTWVRHAELNRKGDNYELLDVCHRIVELATPPPEEADDVRGPDRRYVLQVAFSFVNTGGEMLAIRTKLTCVFGAPQKTMELPAAERKLVLEPTFQARRARPTTLLHVVNIKPAHVLGGLDKLSLEAFDVGPKEDLAKAVEGL